MDVFLAAYGRYLWLAGSLLGAVLVDWATVRVMFQFVRPASVYVFWVGRAGKLMALLAWLLFFNGFWWPEYARGDLDDTAKWMEIGAVLAFAVFAFITLPRFT